LGGGGDEVLCGGAGRKENRYSERRYCRHAVVVSVAAFFKKYIGIAEVNVEI
jgi:hypothetical protein